MKRSARILDRNRKKKLDERKVIITNNRKFPKKPSKAILKKSELKNISEEKELKENLALKWKPEDDLILILNVLRTNSLQLVHKYVKFSENYNYEQIENRWRMLLYEPSISNRSMFTIRSIHPSLIETIENYFPITCVEKNILRTIQNEPFMNSFVAFKNAIDNNGLSFPYPRHSKRLFKEWTKLRAKNKIFSRNSLYQLNRSLPADQTKKVYSQKNIESAQESYQELSRFYDRKIREYVVLEEEIAQLLLYQTMLATGKLFQVGNDVLAIMKGLQKQFVIKSKHVTVGRTTKHFQVDLDLSSEGYSNNISRFQAVIDRLSNGVFMIYNCGTKKIQINHGWIEPGCAARLPDGCFIKFGFLMFVFKTNPTLECNVK